jgi:hypothetical protein
MVSLLFSILIFVKYDQHLTSMRHDKMCKDLNSANIKNQKVQSGADWAPASHFYSNAGMLAPA